MTAADRGLELTGERTLPGIRAENYWFQRHLAAYRLAASISRGRRVIDVGCGEGYGAALIAENALEVLGVDIAPEVVEHASATYPAKDLSFRVMDVNNLELPPESFDVALSLQVVEHLADVSGYFTEMARVLKPGGTAFLTTPNRLTISPGSDEPINPFHLREYTPDEFGAALSRHFTEIELSGVFHARWLRLNEIIGVVDFIDVYTMKKYNPRLWAHRMLTPLIRTSDFRVSSVATEECLDIVAVCRI